jgi:transposase-like protein
VGRTRECLALASRTARSAASIHRPRWSAWWVMMYVRFPLALRNVEDLLFERGIDISHETVRMW